MTKKVTSTKSISFPKLGWGISAGETKQLPDDIIAQERILSEPSITPEEQLKPIISKEENNKK